MLSIFVYIIHANSALYTIIKYAGVVEQSRSDAKNRVQKIQISKEEVRQAIQDLKMRKAAGPSGVTAEMIKAAGEQAVDWLNSICNRIVKEEAIPESWQMSELVPIYKGKGDVLECGSSRGIKLLEHGIKVAERVLERRLRQAVEIDKMQFGFRPCTGTTHAIFIASEIS